MDFSARIQQLMLYKGNISEYRLSKDAGIAQSTLSNILHNGALPNAITLESLCRYFGITLSQFFFDPEKETMYPVTAAQREMLERSLVLTPRQQEVVRELISCMNEQDET